MHSTKWVNEATWVSKVKVILVNLAKGHSDSKIKFLKNCRVIWNLISCEVCGSTRMKIYMDGLGHMTKMVAMPIYGKIPWKIFFSRTIGPIAVKPMNQWLLKLCMCHWILEHYQDYTNDDLRLTFFYGKVKYGKILECKISQVLEVFV